MRAINTIFFILNVILVNTVCLVKGDWRKCVVNLLFTIHDNIFHFALVQSMTDSCSYFSMWRVFDTLSSRGFAIPTRWSLSMGLLRFSLFEAAKKSVFYQTRAFHFSSSVLFLASSMMHVLLVSMSAIATLHRKISFSESCCSVVVCMQEGSRVCRCWGLIL